MKFGRVLAAVVGSLLLLIGGTMLVASATIGLGYQFGRDDDGFVDSGWERLEAEGVALTSDEVSFDLAPGTSRWIVDLVDVDVRLRARCATSPCDLFVGIARGVDVDAYLDRVARSQVDAFADGGPVVTEIPGEPAAASPDDQGFWAVSSSGPGEREVRWDPAGGDWVAVVMPTDATAGFSVEVEVGLKSGLIGPMAITGVVLGLMLFGAGVALIIVGTGRDDDTDDQHRSDDGSGEGSAVPFAPPDPAAATALEQDADTPVSLNAHLDAPLSRWQWLVKWFLAIPHVVVLTFLWIAFFGSTFAAGVAILFTGRYPPGIFRYNRGVLRWTWRVAYYASTGGIGTDRYPPFSLGEHGDYPATLDIEPPGRLSRGLVLVKWWLLAIPHYILLALVFGSLGWLIDFRPAEFWIGGSLLGLLVFAAGLMLLFTGRYPGGLFDMIIGVNRWLFRVVAYAALMTDAYPPFRLDQGGREPTASKRSIRPESAPDRTSFGVTRHF